MGVGALGLVDRKKLVYTTYLEILPSCF